MKSVDDPYSAVVDFFDEAFFERPHQDTNENTFTEPIEAADTVVHVATWYPTCTGEQTVMLVIVHDSADDLGQGGVFGTPGAAGCFAKIVVLTTDLLIFWVITVDAVNQILGSTTCYTSLQGDDFAMDAFHDRCLSLDGVLYVDDINPLLTITVKKGIYDCLFCLDREASFAEFPDQVVTDDVSVTGFQLTAFAVELQLTSCSGFVSQLIQPFLQICVLMTKSSPKVLVVIIGPTLTMLEPGDLSRHLEYRRRNDGNAIDSLGKRQSDLDGHFFFCK